MNQLRPAVVAFVVSLTVSLAAQAPADATKRLYGSGPDDPRPAPWAINQGKVLPPYDGPKGTPDSAAPTGVYVALGDSITNGVGVKQRCQPFPVRPVDVDEFCPGGTSYAVLTAHALRAAGVAGNFLNAGISGAHVGSVLRDEIPYVPEDATVVTVYIGTNDSRPGAVPKHDSKYIVDQYEKEYEEMLSAIHAKAPKARIILVNFPNERYLNGSESSYKIPETVLPLYDEISQVLTRFIDSHYPAYAVVDTACNPQSYDMSLQSGASVHPNEDGARILAASVIRVALAKHPEPPPSSCKWYDQAVAAEFAKKLQ